VITTITIFLPLVGVILMLLMRNADERTTRYTALGVAAAPLFLGEPVLTHFPGPDTEPLHLGTIEVMTAVLFDFGIFLLVFGFAVGLVSSFARSISQREAADPETLPREGGAL